MLPFQDVLAALRTATLEARQRMQDPTLAVAVRRGRYVVQSVVPQANGACTVTNLSDYGTAFDAVCFLNNL